MGRIETKFAQVKENKKKAFVAYLTAGDPDLATTAALVPALEKAGVDILEIGVPFSDPTADGPVIQAAAQRALSTGVTLEAILEMVAGLRKQTEIPIVLFGYYNPIFSYGNERFAKRAKEAGIDAILIVELPPEEAAELRRFTDAEAIDFISLIAPTTGAERMASIAKDASGFLYYISVTGVTGSAVPVLADIEKDMEAIRAATDLPVAVGFGISTPEQAAAIAPLADGIVIGSAVVRLIDAHSGQDGLIAAVSSYAAGIRMALDNP